MDRDYLWLGIFIIAIFLLSWFVSYAVGVELLPIFNPDFCYDSFSPVICFKLWGFLELSAICIIVYFVVGRKNEERIRG